MPTGTECATPRGLLAPHLCATSPTLAPRGDEKSRAQPPALFILTLLLSPSPSALVGGWAELHCCHGQPPQRACAAAAPPPPPVPCASFMLLPLLAAPPSHRCGPAARSRRLPAMANSRAPTALAAAVHGCASPPRRSRDSSPLPPAVSVTMAATTGAAVRRRLLCSWSGHHGQAAAERSSPTRVRGSPVLPHYSSPSIAASPAGFREPRRPPCSKSRQGPPTKIRRKSGF